MSLVILGEIAALLASVCFAIGPTMNTLAGQRVSVGTVNRTRLLITAVLLLIPHWLTQGEVFPLHASLDRWFWMGLSGLFGLVFGDTLLFLAFGLVGTRLTMLVASLIPVCSALLAWFLLGERLAWIQIVGILVTIGGVTWVVSDRGNGSLHLTDRRVYIKGFALAGGAAFLNALGGITAKKGLSGDFPALSGHLIRTYVSMAVLLISMLIQGRLKTTLAELKFQPISLRYILIGAIFGPLTGMWLSLLAIQNISVGIATSLTSLPPIWLLPIGYYLFKEHIGPRAIVGSLIAILGVAIIFLL
jgi:drug/metabolite transporter (DMT)-like permease